MSELIFTKNNMTATEARASFSTKSWGDYTVKAGSNPSLGEQILFIDNQANEHFLENSPFENPLTKNIISNGEKISLLDMKKSGLLEGSIRDTTSRHGEAKEYDHMHFKLSREEFAKIGNDGLKLWMKTIVDTLKHPPAEKGGKIDNDSVRQMIVSPLHLDKDEPHFHVILHNIPVDLKKKFVGASEKIHDGSGLSKQLWTINKKLVEQNLPELTSILNNAKFEASALESVTSAIENGTINPEVESALRDTINFQENGNKQILENGGEITPAMDKSSSQKLSDDLAKMPAKPVLSAESALIDRMLSESIRENEKKQKEASESALKVALAQHAKAAVVQADTLARELSSVQGTLENTEKALENTEKTLDTTKAEKLDVLKENTSLFFDRDKLLKNENDLKNNILVLKDQFSATMEELTASTKMTADLQENLTNLSSKYDELEDLKSKIASKLEFSQTQIAEFIKANDRLTNENEKNKAALLSSTTQVKSLAETNNALIAQVKSFTEKENIAKVLLTQKDERIARLEADNLVLNQRFKELEKAVNDSSFKQILEKDDIGIKAEGFKESEKREPVWPTQTQLGNPINGQQRIKCGSTILLTDDKMSKVQSGEFTKDAAEIMVQHAIRSGWNPVKIQTSNPDQEKFIIDSAIKNGIEIEGFPSTKKPEPDVISMTGGDQYVKKANVVEMTPAEFATAHKNYEAVTKKGLKTTFENFVKSSYENFIKKNPKTAGNTTPENDNGGKPKI